MDRPEPETRPLPSGRRKNGRARFALVIATVALGLFGTSTASAFCRSKTCGEDCTFDANTCPVEGIPIAWKGSCVSYAIQRDGTSTISHDELTQAADAAFRTWQEATCPSTGTPPTISLFNLFGVTACGRVEFNPLQANANVVVIRETWDGDSSVLGLTTVSLNRDTAEIFDVDMEINGTQLLSVGALKPGYYDLESIITHEAGHFLGIAHSNDNCPDGATMCPRAAPGVDNFRTLSEDDVAAVCDVYPPDREPTACNPTPHRGFSPECGLDPIRGGACSLATSPVRPASAMSAVVVGLALAARLLRRPRRRGQKLT